MRDISILVVCRSNGNISSFYVCVFGFVGVMPQSMIFDLNLNHKVP